MSFTYLSCRKMNKSILYSLRYNKYFRSFPLFWCL
uniref:Photosystem I subunit VIII n=1 Tax=Hansenia forrestii TaxID=1050841 RepID=A0A6C0MR49_9APIA|nr:photosystem I subunit VIII [Hansenia forrestii]